MWCAVGSMGHCIQNNVFFFLTVCLHMVTVGLMNSTNTENKVLFTHDSVNIFDDRLNLEASTAK